MHAAHSGHPHFVLATDLAPAAQPHLEFAARLGDALDARTTLFHAAVTAAPLVDPTGLATVAALPDQHATARTHLQLLAKDLATTRPLHAAVEPALDPATAIVKAAERLHADLLVLPTHGRTGLHRALLGSVAERVLRRAPCPVLLLTDAMTATQRDAGQGPILLAVDPATPAAAAARLGVDLARRLHRPLRLFSVVPERELPPLGGGLPLAAGPSSMRERQRARLQWLRQLALEVSADTEVEVDARADANDDAATAIRAAAIAEGASFVVLTTHGRKGVARLLAGSVAEQVARTSTVPVICVRVAAKG